MTTWAEIESAPGFAARAAAVLAHLVEEHAKTADDEQAYRAFATKMLRPGPVPNLTITPHDDRTVTVSSPAINDRIMPWSSFVDGNEIVAVRVQDLTALPTWTESDQGQSAS